MSADNLKQIPTAPAARGFGRQELDSGFKRQVVRSGAMTLVAQTIKLGLSLLSTMILARLLTPGDFGVVAMVASITGFLGVFRDAGLSSASVQRADLSEQQASALFWINAFLGLLLGVVCFASGPLIANFYGDDRLVAVASVSALAFVFGGLAAQHQALLRRAMRLRDVAVIDVLSLAAGIFVAVVLGRLGAGYMALAWMPVATAAAHAIGVIIAARWLPTAKLGKPDIGGLVRFGAHLTAFDAINYFARNLDNILIGKVWGAAPLGLYARAYSLLMLPITQVNRPIGAVAFPALSRLQSDPVRFRRYYLNALFLLTALTTPLCLIMAVLAPEVVLIVLGPQWVGAAQIFRLLAISAIAQPLLNTSGWLYAATGNTRDLFKWGTIGALWLVASFFVGLPYGPEGVATAYAGAIAIWAYPCMRLAVRGTMITVGDVFRAVRDPLLAALPGIVWMLVVRHVMSDEYSIWLWLFVALVGIALIYVVMLSRVLGRGAILADVYRQIIKRSPKSFAL